MTEELSIMQNFEKTCKKCESKNIEIQDERGFSEDSGCWGEIYVVCVDCGNREIIGG